jgi:hypothetical protein
MTAALVAVIGGGGATAAAVERPASYPGAPPQYQPAFSAKIPGCPSNGFRGKHWSSFDSGHIRIHANAPYQLALGRLLARQINGVIWPKLKRLLKRQPPSDRSETECWNGGNGLFDVYLPAHRPKWAPRGAAITFPSYKDELSCGDTPTASFIYIPTPTRSLRWIAAHEFFHAFAYAFHKSDCSYTYGSWEEALATWAGDYVYPHDDEEHRQPAGLEKAQFSMNVLSYNAWVFPYFVTKTDRGGAKFVRDVLNVWEDLHADPGIDSQLDGGFKKQWPEFSLYAWNQDPVTKTRLGKSFREWDRFGKVPAEGAPGGLTKQSVALGGAALKKFPLPVALGPLTRQYFHIQITDPKARDLTYDNTISFFPTADVHAFVKLADGSWRIDDWNKETVEYCRDEPSQDVRELIVVASNSSIADVSSGGVIKPADQPTLTAESTCALRYKVLSLSHSTRARGSMNNFLCDSVGPVSGTRNYDASLTAPDVTISELRKNQDLGTVDGAISVKTPARWTNQVSNGCKFDETSAHLVACTFNGPDESPTPDGKSTEGFSVHGKLSDPTLQLTWFISDPEVGYIDDPCNVHIWAPLPLGADQANVPTDTLTKPGPITLTFNASKHLDHDGLGTPASIDYSWTYSMTIQRVDKSGNPL